MTLEIMVEEIEQEVERETRLPTPRELKNKIQINSEAEKTVLESLEKKDLKKSLVIDCSHGNSGKDYLKQPIVFKDVLEQRKKGNDYLVGVMLESYLIDRAGDKYGQSKTDKCMGWEMTEGVVKNGLG